MSTEASAASTDNPNLLDPFEIRVLAVLAEKEALTPDSYPLSLNALREGSTAHLFAAYGVTPNGDDPLSKALQGLITHAVAQEQRIETILATLKAAGICCQAVPECDKFDSEQMNKLVD